MNLRFLFVLAIFAAHYASGQYVLEGVVTDAADNLPIIGATVYLPDIKKGAVTDDNGKFSIENLPKGKFLLEVKYIGYASLVKAVEVQNSVQLNLSLSATITELNEIVISGVSHSTELKRNPVSVVTLNSDALAKNTTTNIIDNIAQKPGINQITTGPGVSKPVIRGVGYNRVITLYDGIRQEGQQWGDEHGIEIDEFSVDRVEIIKGAGSLMYGSDGIGGVINFLAPNPIREGTIDAHWISNYQSNNRLIANSISNSGNIKGLYWSARASQKAAQAYQNTFDGRVFNSGFKENNFNMLAGINRSWGYSQVSLSSFNQTVGLPEGNRDAEGRFLMLKNNDGMEDEVPTGNGELQTYTIFIPKQGINHFRLSNSTNLFRGNSRMQLNVGYQKNLRKEFANVLDEGEAELFFDLRTLNYNVIAYLPETKGWNVSFGISGMSQRNVNRGEEFLIPEYRLLDVGVVSFVKKNFKKLDVAGGIRFDNRQLSIQSLYLDDEGRPSNDPADDLKFSAAEVSFSNFSASLGSSYQINDLFSLKINASRGFRAPSIPELSSNGRHEGSFRYEYGNRDLKAETSFQTDFGMLVNSPHVSAELAVYQNTISNYIFIEKLTGRNGLDSIPDPSDPAPAFIYTHGKAQLVGGEFSMDLHPHPLDWLHFENSFSIVYGTNKSRQTDSSRYLPFTPAPKLQSELRANAKRWKHFANIFFKIQYQYIAKQNRVLLENGTESPTDAYSLWHTGFGLDFINRKQKNVASLYCGILNVFDANYQHHLSRLKYAPENPLTGRPGIFNMGRNYNIKLLVPISIKHK